MRKFILTLYHHPTAGKREALRRAPHVPRVFVIALLASALTLWSQDLGTPVKDLLVIVNVAAKVDSIEDKELHRILHARDDRFMTLGIQEQNYKRILKEFGKTDPSQFEREWIALILGGKRSDRPVHSENVLSLIGMAKRKKDALVIVIADSLHLKPEELGVKAIKIYKKK